MPLLPAISRATDENSGWPVELFAFSVFSWLDFCWVISVTSNRDLGEQVACMHHIIRLRYVIVRTFLRLKCSDAEEKK